MTNRDRCCARHDLQPHLRQSHPAAQYRAGPACRRSRHRAAERERRPDDRRAARSRRDRSIDVTMRDVGTRRPQSSTVALNSSRSSARWIASIFAPISSMPSSSKIPACCSSRARFNAVPPPIVASTASGRSRRSTAATPSRSSGSRYVRSAKPGSVMIVAGFELTTIVRNPSSRRTFSAWQPA